MPDPIVTGRPIIFSAPMILALLEGRKSMTRRLAWKEPPVFDPGGVIFNAAGGQEDYIEPHVVHEGKPTIWQSVKPGDMLWVREALSLGSTFHSWKYTATDKLIAMGWPDFRVAQMADWARRQTRKSVSPIHMPRWASRITLRVTATKVERLQDISEEDAKAEGCGLYVPGHGFIEVSDLSEGYSNYLAPRMGFEMIWRELHGDESWQQNPEVVALTFIVIKTNINPLPEKSHAA